MTLVIELPKDLEQQLVREAARAGRDPSDLAVETLRKGLASPEGTAAAPTSESELLLKINEGLPPELWGRYRGLRAKLRAQTLTPQEHEALIAISNQIEAANVRRIEWLGELARLRGLSLREVMDQLGIKQPPYE